MRARGSLCIAIDVFPDKRQSKRPKAGRRMLGARPEEPDSHFACGTAKIYDNETMRGNLIPLDWGKSNKESLVRLVVERENWDISNDGCPKSSNHPAFIKMAHSDYGTTDH